MQSAQDWATKNVPGAIDAVAQLLPSMFGWSEYCDAGGLLSYGAKQRATYFRLATYADRILRGEIQPIFLSNSRPSLNWRSISRPPRR